MPDGLNKRPKYLYSGAIAIDLLPIKNFSLCITLPDLLKIIMFVYNIRNISQVYSKKPAVH